MKKNFEIFANFLFIIRTGYKATLRGSNERFSEKVNWIRSELGPSYL